ncbi:MAG: YitT family protein [Bacilli bacterium]|nr:YitT family protein [Bacilli bacterium]
MKDIKELIIKKNRLVRIILILAAILLSAIVYNLFLLPLSLVTGGTGGIATITHYLYDIDPALMILILSLACCIISFMYLGVERTTGTLLASFLYPLMVKMTSNISTQFMIDTSDVLLVVLFAGVLSGVANGLMYKSGYSNGGFPVISQVLYEKFQISIAKSSMIINVIIVLVGAFFFGTTNALYAIIYLYINNIVMDRVLLGISTNKAFYIMTHKEEEIKDYIINNLHHTVTTFNVKGGFLEDKRKVILTVIPSSDYYKLTEGIKTIDEEAFFVATDSYQVEGAK